MEGGTSRVLNDGYEFEISITHLGEDNGNPLQCSCLENPRDGGASWADVYGVTQSEVRATAQVMSSPPNSNYQWSCKKNKNKKSQEKCLI